MSQEAEINRLEIEIVFLLEEPSAQEIKAKLVEQVKSNKLSKSETNEVLAYFNGTVNLSKVKHLLNK